MTPELEIYLEQHAWLLREYLTNLRAMPAELLVASPPVALEGNNLVAIAKHASGVTRAYVLGIGCGLDVGRDRSREFVAEAGDAALVIGQMEALLRDIAAAFEVVTTEALNRTRIPPQQLWGTGEPREMSGREAIVHNIRHLGIHLGEMRLTRSLLESSTVPSRPA